MQSKDTMKDGDENVNLEKKESGKNGNEEIEGKNAVKVRLEGTQVIAFCSYKNIKKHVNVQVRPLFVSSISIITITI
jgi:hypothetical protein